MVKGSLKGILKLLLTNLIFFTTIFTEHNIQDQLN